MFSLSSQIFTSEVPNQIPLTHKKTTSFKPVIWLLITMFSPGVYAAADYFVDAHSQVDEDFLGADHSGLATVYSQMATHNVQKTILSTRGPLDPNAVALDTIDARIVDGVRTKKGPYLNPEKPLSTFQSYFVGQETTGYYGALQELLIYHGQKLTQDEYGNTVIKAEEYIIPMLGDKVAYAISRSIANDWPTVLHIEFAAMPADEKQVYMDDLETLLDTYPTHPFVLIHMGQLSLGGVMQLIMRHDNIYFMTSHTDPLTDELSHEPWTIIFQNGVLARQWRNAFLHFPTRFIFALDNVFPGHWTGEYDGQNYGELYFSQYEERMAHWKNAMDDLPDDVANQIAHKNAECLWGLPECTAP